MNWKGTITSILFFLQCVQMWLLFVHFNPTATKERSRGSHANHVNIGTGGGAGVMIPKPNPFPLLSDLVDTVKADNGQQQENDDKDKNVIINDISWLLDYTLAGLPQTGMETFETFLGYTNRAMLIPGEQCITNESRKGRLKDVVEFLLSMRTDDGNVIRGTHCMTDLERMLHPTQSILSQNFNVLQKYFPQTKLILGLRHPVLWFESMYNHHLSYGAEMPPPYELIGDCGVDWLSRNAARKQKRQQEKKDALHTASMDPKLERRNGVCTDRTRFHYLLASLGKTPMREEEELAMLFADITHTYPDEPTHYHEAFQKRVQRTGSRDLTNAVFLYEYNQLSLPFDKGNNKQQQQQKEEQYEFWHQLTSFLGIPVHIPPNSNIFARIPPPQDDYGPLNSDMFLNICSEEHLEVRAILLEHAHTASKWIRMYFIKSKEVTIGSPEAFLRFLEDWEKDPCEERLREENKRKKKKLKKEKKKAKNKDAKKKQKKKKKKKNTNSTPEIKPIHKKERLKILQQRQDNPIEVQMQQIEHKKKLAKRRSDEEEKERRKEIAAKMKATARPDEGDESEYEDLDEEELEDEDKEDAEELDDDHADGGTMDPALVATKRP